MMLPRIMPVPSGGATGDSQLSSDHVGAVAEAPRLGIQPEWLEVWWDKPSSSVTGFRPGFTGVSRTVLGGGTIRCLSHGAPAYTRTRAAPQKSVNVCRQLSLLLTIQGSILDC